MSTISAITLVPLSGIISAASLGTFLAWMLIVVLAVTGATLLPMIFASIYDNAKRQVAARPVMGNAALAVAATL